ncbi:hypothetical protein T484DRAFT_1956771 [Baffinella frigidus]|nr:hypothetical protein T484DRAFT_1956771 [Cryptophyta sp. CCMP2293]
MKPAGTPATLPARGHPAAALRPQRSPLLAFSFSLADLSLICSPDNPKSPPLPSRSHPQLHGNRPLLLGPGCDALPLQTPPAPPRPPAAGIPSTAAKPHPGNLGLCSPRSGSPRALPPRTRAQHAPPSQRLAE